MKYYIIAGEASGDLHASNLIKEIKRNDKDAVFRAWGGDLMQDQGAEIVKHYRELAFMGFTEVVMNLRTILSNISFCKKDIINWKPDVIILVDYPGFNLRIAEFASLQKLKTVYYISPQLWAWKESRIQKIKKFVDLMLVILPFEKDFYAKHQYEVKFTGHPLLDAIKNISASPRGEFKKKYSIDENKKLVALLPGSRQQEVKNILPHMLEATSHFPEVEFVLGIAPSLTDEFIQSFNGISRIKCVRNETYPLLVNADAALVTSGTATLETALFNVPEVVCYKGGQISYLIARSLVKVKYISLVNLIMDKMVVRELIQNELNASTISSELKSLLYDENYRNEMLNNYLQLRERCGGAGASKNAANEIKDFLQS